MSPKPDFLHSQSFRNTFVVPQHRSVSTNKDEKNDKQGEIIENTLQYVRNRAQNIISVIDSSEKNGKEATLLQALEDVELCRQNLRKKLSLVRTPASTTFFQEKSIQNIAVENGEEPGVCLKITLFPLCAYPIKGAYNVYFEVKEAISKAKENGLIPSVSLNKRYVLIYNRVVPGELGLAQGRCDNDHFEMGRVTNAITEEMGIADSVDKLSFFFTTTSGNEAKTEIYLVEEDAFLL